MRRFFLSPCLYVGGSGDKIREFTVVVVEMCMCTEHMWMWMCLHSFTWDRNRVRPPTIQCDMRMQGIKIPRYAIAPYSKNLPTQIHFQIAQQIRCHALYIKQQV